MTTSVCVIFLVRGVVRENPVGLLTHATQTEMEKARAEADGKMEKVGDPRSRTAPDETK